MRVRIHRGAEEIGGSCVELAAADGSRIVLDVGCPLSADSRSNVELPAVDGFRTPHPSLLGVVVSHPHLDHYGLIPAIATDVPVYIGREAAAVLSAASFFAPTSAGIRPQGFLHHREPVTIGPFRVTPHLVDHSAFDAYSLLVEADGRRLFYTGDLRGHGRKGSLFAELLAYPPADVDVLLVEGTHVRADGCDDDVVFPTERELEDRFVEVAQATAGAVVVFGSMQNLDRLVTVYRAARRSGRATVLDLYGATVAAATRPTIPQPGFSDLLVYLPRRQRGLVKHSREFLAHPADQGAADLPRRTRRAPRPIPPPRSPVDGAGVPRQPGARHAWRRGLVAVGGLPRRTLRPGPAGGPARSAGPPRPPAHLRPRLRAGPAPASRRDRRPTRRPDPQRSRRSVRRTVPKRGTPH